MKKKQLKKIENQMIQVGVNLNKIESLSRILLHCIRFDENFKNWDIENLSSVLFEKLLITKQKFNNIEKSMKI
jgi:hypothetical protein